MARLRTRRAGGQAAVEFVAVLPALVLAALAAWWLASAAAAWLQAGASARAGARAEAVGEDGAALVRAALPASGSRVRVLGRDAGVGRIRVDVRVAGPWGIGTVVLPVQAEAAAP